MPVTCPELFREFVDGKFVVQVSNRKFSKMHYGHAHEQCNKVIKSISGPISFVNRTDDDIQRRWEISGPEIAQYLENAENIMTKNKKNTNNTQAHHEDNPSHNILFSKESATITSRLKAINPFLEKKFVVFGTNAEFSEKVHQFAKQIPDVGQTQYEEFVKTRLITCQKRVSDTIKKQFHHALHKAEREHKFINPNYIKRWRL